MNDSLVAPNRERDRRPIRFLVFGIITILVFGDADDPPGLPPDHERRRCRRPRRGTADRGPADPRDPRPDLRPTGPPARQQRRHLGRQDHAVRPAVLRARRRLAASGEPARHGGVGDPHHARHRARLPVRPGPRRLGRAGRDRAPRRRVVRRPARRAGRRRDAARVPRRTAARAHPRLHGAGRRRHLREAPQQGLPRGRPDREDGRGVHVRVPAPRDVRHPGRGEGCDRQGRPGPVQQAGSRPGRLAHAHDRQDHPDRGHAGRSSGA